jgi:hypothetical protein
MPKVEIVNKHNAAARRLYIRGHNGKVIYLLLYIRGYNGKVIESTVIYYYLLPYIRGHNGKVIYFTYFFKSEITTVK